MASAQGNTQQLPRAGGLYILEAANASFASAQQVILSGLAPSAAYMVGYPYRDAGVLDTAALMQDPTFSPQATWLAGPVGTLFGTGINATAVLFLVNVRRAPSPWLLHASQQAHNTQDGMRRAAGMGALLQSAF